MSDAVSPEFVHLIRAVQISYGVGENGASMVMLEVWATDLPPDQSGKFGLTLEQATDIGRALTNAAVQANAEQS